MDPKAAMGGQTAKQRVNYSMERNGRLVSTLLFPSIAIVGTVSLYPLLYSLYLSFYNYQLTRPDQTRFAPVRNILKLFRDRLFFDSLENTLIFTGATVFFGVLLGLLMALVIESVPGRIISGLRGIAIIPWVIPGIVVGYLFAYIFDTNVGLANHLLRSAGLLDENLPWLMHSKLAMAAVIIANVWTQAPFYMLMFAAALKSIPESAREAAYAEGATRLQEFRFVTFPAIRGVIVITSLLGIIRNFNNFPIIFTMTGGGPAHATLTSVLYIYKVAFDRFDMGYAALLGVVWIVAMMIVSVVYVRMLSREF
jgi:multiple sugar transport system permease protein